MLGKWGCFVKNETHVRENTFAFGNASQQISSDRPKLPTIAATVWCYPSRRRRRRRHRPTPPALHPPPRRPPSPLYPPTVNANAAAISPPPPPPNEAPSRLPSFRPSPPPPPSPPSSSPALPSAASATVTIAPPLLLHTLPQSPSPPMPRPWCQAPPIRRRHETVRRLRLWQPPSPLRAFQLRPQRSRRSAGPSESPQARPKPCGRPPPAAAPIPDHSSPGKEHTSSAVGHARSAAGASSRTAQCTVAIAPRRRSTSPSTSCGTSAAPAFPQMAPDATISVPLRTRAPATTAK